MVTLYVDKFRGFKDTIVALADVNFLVGENSTGKSSLLALLHLLSSPDFWFLQNFNLPEYEFGGFADILSAESKRTDEFSFGLSSSVKHFRTKEKGEYTYLVSYQEKDALPSVTQFARLDRNRLLSFRQFKQSYRYRTEVLSIEEMPNNVENRFALLKTEGSRPIAHFSELPKSMPARAGFFPLLSMLEGLSEGQELEDHELIFPIPLFAHNMAWLAPIRTRPRRTYDGYGRPFSPEGEHTPYLIRKSLKSHGGDPAFRKALIAFGTESGLFSEVAIHDLGDDAASPFELMIRLRQECALRINSVGYGVSQVLPLVVEMLARRKGSWFALQQPEVHLHPRAQAALGDVIYQVAEADSKCFLIETHSDFTIDRFRMNYRKHHKHKSTAQVLFFAREDSGNLIHRIPIQKNGEYPHDQPSAFRDFFLKEQISLLGL